MAETHGRISEPRGQLAIWTASADAGALSDHRLTPGTFNPSLSVAAICSTKWGKDARHVHAQGEEEAESRRAQSEKEPVTGITGSLGSACGFSLRTNPLSQS